MPTIDQLTFINETSSTSNGVTTVTKNYFGEMAFEEILGKNSSKTEYPIYSEANRDEIYDINQTVLSALGEFDFLTSYRSVFSWFDALGIQHFSKSSLARQKKSRLKINLTRTLNLRVLYRTTTVDDGEESAPVEVDDGRTILTERWKIVSSVKSYEVPLLNKLDLTQKEGATINIYKTKPTSGYINLEEQGDGNSYFLVEELENVDGAKYTYPEFTKEVKDSDIVRNRELGQYDFTQLALEDHIEYGNLLIDNRLTEQPNGCNSVEYHENQVYLAGFLGDQNLCRYSETISDTLVNPFVFRELLFSFKDRITGLKSMDNHIIIFTDSAERFLYAPSFTSPREVIASEDSYPLNQSSIIKTPEGVLFHSNKGILRFNRANKTEFIGTYIEDLKGIPVVDAYHHKENFEVRFLLETGQIAIYNYFLDLWFLREDQNIKSIEKLSDRTVALDKEGSFYLFDDLSKDMEFELGWVSFKNVATYKRLKEIRISGDLENIEFMKVKIAYDYADDFEVMIPARLPQPDPDGFFDTQSVIKHIDFFPRRQKCSSFKLVVQLKAKGKVSLSNVSLTVGVQNTKRQISSDNLFGG